MPDVDLYLGDCKDQIKKLPDDMIDLVVTSPPYDNLRNYHGYVFEFENIAKELVRVIKPGGIIVWIVNDATVKGSETGTSFKQAMHFMQIGMSLYDTMIWLKPSPQAPTEGRYYDVFEYMFILSKGKPKTLNLIEDRRNKSAGTICGKESRSSREDRKMLDTKRMIKEYSRRFNVWEISRGHNKTEHPAVFPLTLAKDHILSWSNECDVVLDPFMGSGTTGLAASLLRRNFIGIEIDPSYFDIAKRRIETLDDDSNEILDNIEYDEIEWV